MIVPGLVYAAFNYGTPQMSGWAIPMATDIAFALGALAILGRGLPSGLRIFLAAFAIADDIGGVIIIAVFYTSELSMLALAAAAAILVLIGLINFLRFQSLLLYALLSFLLWVAVLNSGIHPTIAGVAAALMMPARGKYDFEYFVKKVNAIMCQANSPKIDVCYWYSILMDSDYLNIVHNLRLACEDVETPLQRFEHWLHPYVAFLILPIFALGNAGLTLSAESMTQALLNPVTLGIMLGLVVGKPLGIALFAYFAVKSGLASLPENVNWVQLIGVGLLGGIGFTVSLFISGLSFEAPEVLNYAKLGVLSGSALTAVIGGVLLSRVSR
jgi:NhaA family Na+:H+ antiporter